MKLSGLIEELGKELAKHGDLDVEFGWDDGDGIPLHGKWFDIDVWSDGPGMPSHTLAITRRPPPAPVN